MQPYFESKLNESVEKLRDSEQTLSEKQAKLIKSLSEEERLKMFQLMAEDKKSSSPYQLWLGLNKRWRNFIKIMLFVTLMLFLIFDGVNGGWDNFKEFLKIFRHLFW